MTETATKRNMRAEWDNQHDNSIRNSIISELLNWSRASRGGLPDLGYRHEQSWYTPPRYPDSEKRYTPAEPDFDRAQLVEDTFVMWRLIAKHPDTPEWAGQRLEQLHDALMCRFRDCMTVHDAAKALHCSRRHAYRLIDEALYRFWVISQ